MDRIARQLEMMLTLIDGNSHPHAELCEEFGMTRRNLYYTFSRLREKGFNVVKDENGFYLDPNSPFFKNVASYVNLSDEEAAFLYKRAETTKTKNKYAQSVMKKLRRAYDIRLVTDKKLQNRVMQNVSRISEAMERKRVVVLKNYSSPHSRTVSDRYVEPFMFMNDQSDLRCYELTSNQNKTFKMSRIESVEIIEDVVWTHEDKHKKAFTDLFLFSGEERHHIRLRLGLLARNLLVEEYPQAAQSIKAEDKDHWIFETDVVNYVGIGRFIIGLADDIEVLADDGLRQHLRERIQRLQEHLG